MEVTLHFEASAKWPDDFDAIQHVKTAFYLKISELLKADQQRYGVRPFYFIFRGWWF